MATKVDFSWIVHPFQCYDRDFYDEVATASLMDTNHGCPQDIIRPTLSHGYSIKSPVGFTDYDSI